MIDALTPQQVASMTAEQRQDYLAQSDYMRPLVGRQILEWNAEQRRLRQIERKRQLRDGEITRAEFDAASDTDPPPPTAGDSAAGSPAPAR